MRSGIAPATHSAVVGGRVECYCTRYALPSLTERCCSLFLLLSLLLLLRVAVSLWLWDGTRVGYFEGGG